MLQIEHLHKSYAERLVVNDVCLEVQNGEIFGLLGPNGAGKTTTMSIVAGLIPADSGSVLLDGAVFDTRDPELRRLLGVVPQELAIYPELTGRENLAFFGSLYGFGRSELRRRVDEALEQVGLTDSADRSTGTYSGGMKRRLNFAAAILHNPRLLILDEPTVGVDPQSRSHLLQVVRSLGAGDTTVIYASHYMEEVEAVCHRAAIMDTGRVLVCDTIPALLDRTPSTACVELGGWNDSLNEHLGENVAVSAISGSEGRTLEIINRDGRETVSLGRELARVISLVSEARLPIVRVETREASLERLFLELTGRKLRDGGEPVAA